MKLPKISKKTIFVIVTVILLIIAFIPSLYFYNQYQKLQNQLKNPSLSAKEETQKLLSRVGTLIELPEGEEPTIATISDRDKLADQPFFARAKNGDKLIIYNNAKRAILYDPIANKIIDVAPVNIGTQSASTTNATDNISPTPQPVRFVLLNGTATVGLTKKYEDILKKSLPNVTVMDKDNAKKTDYSKSILVDLSRANSKEADQIGKLLGVTVGKLPEEETRPANADFLIILGEDKK